MTDLADLESIKFGENMRTYDISYKRTHAHIHAYLEYTENAENAHRNSRDRDEGVVGKRRRGLVRSGQGWIGRRGWRR